MYESPLSIIFGEIQTKIIEERENQVIQALQNCGINVDKEELIKALMYDRQQYKKGYADAKAEEPPFAQPEQSLEIQGILDYLDTVLHPIISPEHWNVYSELHDMISTLSSAQPERKKGKWIRIGNISRVYKCDKCGNYLDFSGVNAGRGDANFCPNCGADMRGEQE